MQIDRIISPECKNNAYRIVVGYHLVEICMLCNVLSNTIAEEIMLSAKINPVEKNVESWMLELEAMMRFYIHTYIHICEVSVVKKSHYYRY